MNNIFPFIKLQSYKNGWRYSGKLKEFIRIKHYEHLKQIEDKDIEKISKFLNGSILNYRIFKNFAWVLYLNPVPMLEIYIFCERNSKTGDKFNIFFGKDGMAIPTEDVYGFALVYISLLSLIGKNSSIMVKHIELSNLVELEISRVLFSKLEEFSGKNILSLSEKIKIIEKVNILKDRFEFTVRFLNNLPITYRIKRDDLKIFVSKDSLTIYPKSLIISIATLLLNAFKREI